MPSQLAQILNNFRQTMPEAGSGMRHGMENYVAGKASQAEATAKAEQQGFENKLKTDKDKREADKAKREESKFDQEQADRVKQALLGPVTAADSPEKWASAQQAGFIPKKLKFEDREPFMMATLTEKERIDREKLQLDRAEHGRKTRKDATDKSGAGGRKQLKATDENFIAKQVAALFDGIYDPATGAFQLKDDVSRRKALKIKRDAARLAANNPNMTLSAAVTEAAQRNDININDPANTLPGQQQPGSPGANPSDPLGIRGGP